MYDKTGKKVVEGRMWPPDAAEVSVSSAGATQAGGIVAVGSGTMTDGSIQGFIAKTDLTGRTVQSVHTGRFSPHQVCEATDGTVWTLGYDLDFLDLRDADKSVLRHYSFEKGLLGRLVSLDSISKSRDAILQVSAPGKSFLRCSKDRVSVLFWPSAQYIQVDASSEKFTRWQVAVPSAVGRKATGFAVTEEGKIFVSLTDFSEADNTRTNGLYELNATPGTCVAGQRDLRSHPLHLFEQFDLRVALPGDFLHPDVVFLDALVQRFDFFEQRLQYLAQLRVQLCGQLPAHLLRAALGQPLAIRLHQLWVSRTTRQCWPRADCQ